MPSLGQKLVGGLGAPRPARISLNDGKFTLYMDSGAQHPTVAPSLSIQVIFVGGNSHVSKCFYDEDTYDADTPNAPKCWSDNGVAPSDQVQTPVSPTCAVCPNNKWIGQGASATPPACSDRKKTAVLVSGAGDTVFLLDLPPASLKPFKRYMAYLGGEVRQDPENVLTNLTMENRILQFSAAGYVPDNLKPAIKGIVDNPSTDEVVNEHDRPHQGQLPAPTPAAREFPKATDALYKMQFAPSQFIPKSEAPPEPAPVDIIPEQFTDPRFAQAAADQRAREAHGLGDFPTKITMTAEQALDHNNGKPPRKQRSDKGVARKETTLGAGPIPAGTFDAVDERSPPPVGFIQPEPAKPQFGMAQPAPAPAGLDDMLTKAFGLRVGK